jgi:hypothetical protein
VAVERAALLPELKRTRAGYVWAGADYPAARVALGRLESAGLVRRRALAGGAVVGGVLGGAAGAATQVLTRGDKVQVPAGTVIEFKLEEPWSLNGSPQQQTRQNEPVS